MNSVSTPSFAVNPLKPTPISLRFGAESPEATDTPLPSGFDAFDPLHVEELDATQRKWLDQVTHLPLVGRVVRAGMAFVTALAAGFGILAMAAPSEETQKVLLEKSPAVVRLPMMLGMLAAVAALLKRAPKEKNEAAPVNA